MVAARFVDTHKQLNKDMVNIHSSSRTVFNMNSVPQISLKWELENVHPLIKRLFSSNKVPNVLIAGRLKHFSKGLEKINQGSEYPEFSRWLCKPFQRKPFQSEIPFQLITSREQQKLMDKEVQETLKKTAIRQANTVKGEFLSNLFLVRKTDKGAKGSNKSETSKCIYTIQSLQNGRILESEIFVTRGRLSVQARSKGCILLCSFTEKIEEIRSVPLVRNLYEFLCLCFGLGPAPRIFTKLLKTPSAILQSKTELLRWITNLDLCNI